MDGLEEGYHMCMESQLQTKTVVGIRETAELNPKTTH